ncbi:MAG: OmpA family protein [Caldilineae bacterium]|nr:MAG: OmpA family protein [Caldilineae bacterium]
MVGKPWAPTTPAQAGTRHGASGAPATRFASIGVWLLIVLAVLWMTGCAQAPARSVRSQGVRNAAYAAPAVSRLGVTQSKDGTWILCRDCPPHTRLHRLEDDGVRTALTGHPAAGHRGPFPAVEGRPVHVVQFAFASAAITPDEKRDLARAAKDIPSGASITVKGYTCRIGPKAYNDRLARARADAVAHLLDRLGIAPYASIRIEGHGKCCYVADNDTKEGRARNRRAEIYITLRKEKP